MANLRRAEQNARYKEAFEEVAETYRTIQASGVKLDSKDYSTHTGGQNAQFDPSRGMKTFSYIDFCVDVDLALNKSLFLGDPLGIRKRWFHTTDPDDFIQTNDCLDMQYRIGAMFKELGLHPITTYFNVVKS